ncbi:MAG: phasin family protein [Hyphomonas sp.]|uniref:phasin family protein n=1 Tax=Hyphomonas sp. TaxID=87 RepID=UPI0034A071F9
MAKTTASTARAKAEARPNTATTKQIEKTIDAGLEQVTELAGKFTDKFTGKFTGMAEGGVKALTDSAVASSNVLREIGNRNVSFVTQAMEQSVELTQTLANVRDPREMFELQSAFAKSMLSAYTTELTAQTELCVAAWRNAAKPYAASFAK